MLNPKDNEILEAIVSKPVSELAEHEIGILKARSSYLTDEEKDKFAEILDGKKKAKAKPEAKKPAKKQEAKKPEAKKPEVQTKPEVKEDKDFKKLMEDAMELGIDTTGMTTIEELEKAIDEYLASN